MTQEELKEYLDSRKNDVIDATVDLGLDIAVALISQDIGINFSNSNAQQCIALAYKGSSEAMNELVRSSGITMEVAKSVGFYATLAKNISDFCSLGENLNALKTNINNYYRGDNNATGKILGYTFSALSTVVGFFSGLIGTIVSTQLSIASDLANEAASLSAQYQERYEKLNSIANGKDYDTVSDEVKAFRNEYDAMKEEATKSKEGYMLFKTFVNNYSSLLVAFGCDLSELYSYINEADKYYYGSGEDSINYCENKIEETNYNLAIKFANKSIVDKDKMNNAEAAVKYDPLIIDLDRDGVFTKSKENGVYFDFDGDGFKEKTAWVDDGDGLLVLDRNGNGVIDNGSELFGDKTVLFSQ